MDDYAKNIETSTFQKLTDFKKNTYNRDISTGGLYKIYQLIDNELPTNKKIFIVYDKENSNHLYIESKRNNVVIKTNFNMQQYNDESLKEISFEKLFESINGLGIQYKEY